MTNGYLVYKTRTLAMPEFAELRMKVAVAPAGTEFPVVDTRRILSLNRSLLNVMLVELFERNQIEVHRDVFIKL